ncbi:MAG TPA: hypothetical protein VJR58_12020 [Vineibacter sp.]|nr:hypothetical protein [Vineibacter sp.]
MAVLFAQDIHVHYGQAYLEVAGQFDGEMEPCFRGQQNGICGAAVPDFLFFITGLHTGKVGFSINLFEEDPGIDDLWDEIVEVSFLVPRNEISLVEWGAENEYTIPIGPGTYRARYYARDMQAGRDLDTNTTSTVVDTYRLDVWKADKAADRVVKQTAEIAAYWHDWAATLVSTGS